MNAESLIFRKLTPNEFKAITNTINSEGGGSQTYIDFPKGSISDENFKEFFGYEGTPNTNGFEWVFYVNSLSIGRIQQKEIISARRDSSNSLREQNNENRIEIWKNERSGFPSESYDDKNNPIIVFIIKGEDKEYWAGWFYRNECNDTWPMTKGLSSMLWKDCAYVKFDTPLPFDIKDYKWPFLKSSTSVFVDSSHQTFNIYTTAIRTKPFLLLAGISGTGKSRIVREFAFKSCPKFLQDKEGTTPGNYCMIEVKPNWHDSTELLGYYSNISKGYQFKKFVKFLVKAKMFPHVPFFVCLDEMNLAPVEQYFAEILSILETRKHPKNAETGKVDMDSVKTEVIVEARYFKEFAGLTDKNGNTYNMLKTDRDIYMKLFGIDTESDIEQEVGSQTELTTIGLTLPDNVVIIGTVNMDDTTHQFSRKVIDRAMTIEMNGGRLADMFGGSKNLEYLEDEKEQQKWQASFRQRYVTADEVLTAHPAYAEDIKSKLPARLEAINKALKGTPFEVSYRVLNELTIMVGVMLDEKGSEAELDDIINQAVNNILLMKILPRIEGDAEMFALSREYKTKVGVTHDNRLEWLKELAPDIQVAAWPEQEADDNADGQEKETETEDHPQTAKEKIQEMIDRLNNQEFTRFWP